MRVAQTLVTVTAVVAVAVGATSALGAGVTSIGVLDANDPLSQVNAITPDGQYAVGLSNNGGVSYPVVWSSSGGLVQLPNDADYTPHKVTEARGVIVRDGGSGNPNIIGVAGAASTGWPMQWYEAPVTDVAGSWWNDALGSYTPGPYNAARLSSDGAKWYIAGANNTTNEAVRQRVNSTGAADWQGGNGEQVAHSVSGGYPVGVGYHSPAATHAACYWDRVNDNAGFHAIPGNSDFSEGYGVSNDGTVMSGLDGASSIDFQAFVWGQGDAGMTLLGTLAGDTQSCAIAVNASRTAAGYSSDGATERAVIWDTTGAWDATGQPKLLTDLLTAAGADVSEWTSLTRATTMSDDGMTVAGWGVWAADDSTRGFIATVAAAPTAVQWASVRTHGSGLDELEITLDASASGGVVVSETRDGGVQQIAVDFSSDVTACYTASQVVITGGGSLAVTGEALVDGGTRLEIDLNGGTDETCATIDIGASVSCLTGDTDCAVRILSGDVNGDQATNNTDKSWVASLNGTLAGPDNARFDLNLDGAINNTDKSLVASRNGQSAGCP